MEQSDRVHLDSLRPVETPVLPVTLPPKPIRKRHALIYCVILLIGASMFASALTYWLLLDPVMGEYRLYGALLVGFTMMTQIASFTAHVLIFNEIRNNRR